MQIVLCGLSCLWLQMFFGSGYLWQKQEGCVKFSKMFPVSLKLNIHFWKLRQNEGSSLAVVCQSPTLTSIPLSVFLPPFCVCLCLCMSQYCSLMSGLAALDAKCSSRLGIMTISYYLWTTFVAVVVGIVMVYIIHPGGAAQKEDSEDSKKPMTSSADALLDLIR